MNGIKKLLIVGSFSAGAIEKFYLDGLRKLGIDVEVFASADQFNAALEKHTINRILYKWSSRLLYDPINERISDFIKNRYYDAILVFKGMELYKETIKVLKDHSRVLSNYNCDHPFRFYSPGSGNANVRESIPLYDLHFSYSSQITLQLKANYQVKAAWIPFGYDSNLAIDKSASADEFAGRFLFIGAYDRQRSKMLGKLNSPQLDIYGSEKWRSRNFFSPYILNAFKGRPLYGAEYLTAIRRARGIINFLRSQNILEDTHNMRTFEVPGNGGLLISRRTAEQRSFFEEDKEAVYFDSLDELRDKIDFIDRNPAFAERIKSAGYQRSQTCGYSYNERSKELLNQLVIAAR